VSTALGFRTHTGWAVMCAVRAGSPPTLVSRTRVQMCPTTVPADAYHAAAADRDDLKKAEKLISRVVAASVKGARAAIRGAGDEVVAVALVNEPRDLPSLSRILGSHALIHSAEGDMYREVVAEAAEAEGLRVFHFSASDLGAGGRQDLLRAFGEAVGTPWQREHKDAALAAVMALEQVGARA
jgi:hypothetical protein